MIDVTREKDYDGTLYTATCICGENLSTYVQRGARMPDVPGPMPGDLECDKCGKMYNSGGQELNIDAVFHPEDYGETW